MPFHKIAVLAAATVAAAAPLCSQVTGVAVRRLDVELSPAGCAVPGAGLGVLAYQCASCGLKREDGRAIYTFNAEPVITQVTATSALRAGDVLEAVADKPITTADGAFAFSNPVALLAYARIAEVDAHDIESVEVIKGAAATSTYGASASGGVIFIKLKANASRGRRSLTLSDSAAQEILRTRLQAERRPLIVIDGVVQPTPSAAIAVRVRRDGKSLTLMAPVTDTCEGEGPLSAPRDTVRKPPAALATQGETTGRFGLAVACEPSCSRARARDGTDYWKFDGYPPIAALLPGGPSERVGLRVGDRVTDVDGTSVLTEEGALRFLRSESKGTLQVTVQRNGQRMSYQVTAPYFEFKVEKPVIRPGRPD